LHKIIVAGHTCVDLIPEWNGKFEDITPGHLIVTGRMKFSTGGSVPNTGVALKRLGLDPILIGKIGNDLIGRITLEVVSSNGKNLTDHMIKSSEAGSSYTLVLSPPNVDRAFLHYPGVNDTFCAKDIPFDILNGRIFHFGYPPVMRKIYKNNGNELVNIFQRAHEHKMITSLDMTMPDPKSEAGKIDWRNFLSNVLPHTDIFLPSLDEILYMTRMKGDMSHEFLLELTKELLEWGAKIVVIKLGKNGVYLRSSKITSDDLLSNIIEVRKWSETELFSPAYKANVVGTTGSGDASIAGFLAKFVEGSDSKSTLDFMCAVGAFSVEALDSTSGIKSMKEIEKRMADGWERLPATLHLHFSGGQ
jgi:sugar/nucleoside kinase (ribokinase family)